MWTYGSSYKNLGLVEVTEQYVNEEYGYSWEILGVWWHPDSNSYRAGMDGGCSCNGPWDGHRGLEDFGRPLTYAEARKFIQDAEFYYGNVDNKLRAIDELHSFEIAREG